MGQSALLSSYLLYCARTKEYVWSLNRLVMYSSSLKFIQVTFMFVYFLCM